MRIRLSFKRKITLAIAIAVAGFAGLGLVAGAPWSGWTPPSGRWSRATGRWRP